ncbi:hypothetical protein [uncultured Maribacter sp.]|uniref:hypothetical protein n=1 Tax=uncultured Maribacter sp. TaxID=431308 RepID=UPI0030EBA87D|tara:strand:+ start:21350 stop:22042 length:693 start_codon:yes stop_codon:yes gene_type:complete
MKTTMNFITCVIMVFAITLTSCSKDGDIGPIGLTGAQGEQGIQGEQGPTGEDGEALGVPGAQGETGATGPAGPAGENGTDGVNGQDGNANVIASSWTNLDFPNSWNSNNEARFELSDTNITQEVINSYALLSYVKFTSANTTASSVPFVSLGKQYEIHDSMAVGQYVALAIVNDKVARPTPPTNLQVRYVLIAPSSLSGKNNAPSLEKMEKDGIDTGNYKEVMDYLGLDY